MKSSSVILGRAARRPTRSRQELAFLPAALEIVDTPPAPTGRAIAAIIMLVFAVAIGWSYIGRIDIITSAKGKLIPTGRVKTIQPFETGIVRAIRVVDGQKVKAGEVLIELDPTVSQADVDHTRNDLLAVGVTIARLEAALSDATEPVTAFHPPAGVPPDLIAVERRHLIEQVAQQREKLFSLDRQRAEKEADRATAQATIEGIKATLPVQTQLLEVYKSLFHGGNGSKVQYLQTLSTVVDQQHQIIAQQSRYVQADAAVAGIVANRAEAVAEYRSNLADELAKAEARAAGLSQDLVKAQQRTSLQVLRAPVAGTVQQLAIHTIGGVVTPAQQLLVLVPLDSQIEIVAMIPNREIGFVQVGQPVQVKIDAFNYTQFGLLQGRVVSVSHDSIATSRPEDSGRTASSAASDRGTSEPNGEQLQYDAHIGLDQSRMFIDGNYVDLRPGMAVTAEIKTGSRRIISYLLSPLARYGHESMRER